MLLIIAWLTVFSCKSFCVGAIWPSLLRRVIKITHSLFTGKEGPAGRGALRVTLFVLAINEIVRLKVLPRISTSHTMWMTSPYRMLFHRLDVAESHFQLALDESRNGQILTDFVSRSRNLCHAIFSSERFLQWLIDLYLYAANFQTRFLGIILDSYFAWLT